jgi:hypothetical protein
MESGLQQFTILMPVAHVINYNKSLANWFKIKNPVSGRMRRGIIYMGKTLFLYRIHIF